MRLLFLHQNCPGQFRHVAPHLAAGGDEVVFITQPGKPDLPGVRKVEYSPHRGPAEGVHGYLRDFERAVLNGQGALRAALALQASGFSPDVIVGHPGWGETLYLKEVFREAKLLAYCEFYYRTRGADVGFDPEFPDDIDGRCRALTRDAQHLLALDGADHGYSPTDWQRRQYPAPYLDRIEVIHDGIDTARVRPDPSATVTLPNGVRLRPGDEVVTYVARNLEPYRGFHTFMRALPDLLAARPRATVLVVGGDDVSYGRRLPPGESYRARMLAEVKLPPGRVHFLGQIAYADYLRVLQISAAHVYLTYPFVLSWSMLEAMAAGCLLVGSRTPPVEEVIEDGVNGHLADFFDAPALAARLSDILADPRAHAPLRAAARETIRARFELADCRDRLVTLIRGL